LALVVSGQVRHRHLQPQKVEELLRTRFPGLQTSAPDFSVDRTNCRVEFFCNTTSALDFTVTLNTSTNSATAAVALLVREADSVNAALNVALSGWLRAAETKYCVLEDHRSRSSLLIWSRNRPLTSRAAKISYLLCVVLLTLGAALIYLQLQQPQTDTRDYNIISLALAIGLPVLAIPLPFVLEHFKSKDSSQWLFSDSTGGA